MTARERRAELYHHPIGFLRAALTAGARLERARTDASAAGDGDAVDPIIPNGERFTLFIDRTTHVPRRIVSLAHVAALGDVSVSTTFEAFIDADGLKVPSRITTRMDGTVVTDLTFTAVTVDPPVSELGELEAPADVRTAAASRPPRVTVDEVAPGVWYVAGEGHHSVVAEFADHLTLIEAPVDDRRTLAVIQAACASTREAADAGDQYAPSLRSLGRPPRGDRRRPDRDRA